MNDSTPPSSPATNQAKYKELLKVAQQLASLKHPPHHTTRPEPPGPQLEIQGSHKLPRPSPSYLRDSQASSVSPSYLRANQIIPDPPETSIRETGLTNISVVNEARKLITIAQEALQSQPRAPRTSPNVTDPHKSVRAAENFSLFARELKPAGTPLPFASPLHLLAAIAPDWPAPHAWQREELLRFAGFRDPSKPIITPYTPEDPLKMCLPAANGSGKDQFYIALSAVWDALTGCKNRSIITSSSEKQLKSQTQPHIIDLIERCNNVFGKIFEYIHFHIVCRLTGSEILLFITNEAGRAEGFHPWPGGHMNLYFNEAKTIEDSLWSAFARCTGYCRWLEISSPGPKVGHFYRTALSGIEHPALYKPGRFYVRYVSAYECPHIPIGHIEDQIREQTPEWVDSSINARFSNVGQQFLITSQHIDAATAVAQGTDIGISLDSAASVAGDESSCYVRRGNKIIHHFHFRQADTTVTAVLVDTQLAQFKPLPYTFNADDGGLGHGIVDQLVKLGWRINRILNQSSAAGQPEFLNRGAAVWFHTRKLFISNSLAPIPNDPILHRQLTTRLYEQADTSGKIKLESKPTAKRRTRESPDRADAFVLCFYSYRPERNANDEADSTKRAPAKRMTIEEYIEAGWDGPPKSFPQVYETHRTY